MNRPTEPTRAAMQQMRQRLQTATLHELRRALQTVRRTWYAQPHTQVQEVRLRLAAPPRSLDAAARAAELEALIAAAFADIYVYAGVVNGLALRKYQREPARAIIHSVLEGRGGSIVVMFPRQSGKNELQAQIESYLLARFALEGGEMVKISPTWKPQSLNAMRRLERVLKRNVFAARAWGYQKEHFFKTDKESGYIYRIGKARMIFLSGSPEANIVGATADLLLEVDEAQDVQQAKYDKDVAPMAASTNATRVFWGTAWTSKTLLARERRAAQAAQDLDGVRRVFHITADDVGREVPAYRKFVNEQVAKLGRQHPLVKTQFFSEEIDAETGFFNARRLALMQGDHAPAERPQPGCLYAMLLDVAGEDEQVAEDLEAINSSRRDSTALTIVEVDLATLEDDLLRAPTYRVQLRREWIGTKHSQLYGEIRALAQLWGVSYLVVDATGVGAGLASFLDRALPGKVLPYAFTQKSKSDLGWGFLAVIETGRYKEFAAGRDAEQDLIQARFWEQCEYCESSILDGPGKFMRWGVPEGRRAVETGHLVHDDLLIGSALTAVLDGVGWAISGAPVVLQAPDPLKAMDRGF
ncbi:MAG: hypothetical protein ACK2UW_08975 [Anaerolineales bacterium]